MKFVDIRAEAEVDIIEAALWYENEREGLGAESGGRFTYGYSPSTIPLMYFSMFVYPVLSKSPVASEGSFGFRPYLVSQASGIPSLSVSTGAVPPANVP